MDLPQGEEKQQQVDEDVNNMLSKEIGSWKDFEYAQISITFLFCHAK